MTIMSLFFTGEDEDEIILTLDTHIMALKVVRKTRQILKLEQVF